MDKKEIKGLSRFAGWIFIIIGILISVKGFLDIFILSPSSEFVSIDNWIRYAFFELIYGVACVTLGLFVFKFVNIYLIDKD